MRKTSLLAALLGAVLLWTTIVPDAQALGRWRRNAYYYGGYPAYYGNYGYRGYPGYYGSYYRGYGYPGYYGYSGYYPGYYGGYVNTPWATIGW